MAAVYSIPEISAKFDPVFRQYHVRRAVLFGSYAKGCPKAGSDVDLLVDSGLKGLQFIGLLTDLQSAVDIEVDLFDTSHIEADSVIEQEIRQTGVIIYEAEDHH